MFIKNNTHHTYKHSSITPRRSTTETISFLPQDDMSLFETRFFQRQNQRLKSNFSPT